MKYTVNRNGDEITVAPEGSLDSFTSPALENKILPLLEEAKKFILDFEKVDYISSVGVRLVIIILRKMDERGEFILKNVSPEIMDVFKVTGLIGDLNIE